MAKGDLGILFAGFIVGFLAVGGEKIPSIGDLIRQFWDYIFVSLSPNFPSIPEENQWIPIALDSLIKFLIALLPIELILKLVKKPRAAWMYLVGTVLGALIGFLIRL
jgi:hypothetical protein